MEEFGRNRRWKAPSDNVLAGVSVTFGFVSWALLWLWIPQVVAITCGAVVLRRKRDDDQATLVTTLAGGGVFMGIVTLVLAFVFYTVPESFWTQHDR